MKRKRKSFRQVELPRRPMFEVDIFSDEIIKPEKKISSTVMEVVSEAAAVCAVDPKILKAFFEQLAEQYPDDGQTISLISISPSGKKGVDITLIPLPTLSKGKDRALIHTLGLRCIEGLTIPRSEAAANKQYLKTIKQGKI